MSFHVSDWPRFASSPAESEKGEATLHLVSRRLIGGSYRFGLGLPRPVADSIQHLILNSC